MGEKIICGIYKITNPEGKVYIGHSKDIDTRWRAYRRLDCKAQQKIYNSLKKYGVSSHTFEVVEECAFDDLTCRERFWQDYYDVTDREKGLNLTLVECGDVKKEVSEETREKHRIIAKNRVFSEETLKKLSEIRIGFKHSVETKKRMSEAQIGHKNNLGFKHTDETRKLMSAKSKGHTRGAGRIQSKETKEKIAEYNFKIILNRENGIFYLGVKEAAESLNINPNTLVGKLNGRRKNNTPFIYV
jgi:group I intron endonuclease